MVEQSDNSRSELLKNVAKFFGEFAATAVLVYLGCMGCVNSSSIINSPLQCSLTFGFVVLICIQCFGCISGAHLNPAVTLASFIYELISWQMAILYFVAQILGGSIGYGLLVASMPKNMICNSLTPMGACVTSVASNITLWQAVIIEFLLTSILICVCCGVWDLRNADVQDSVPIRFGLTVSCIGIVAGQLTGASMNPVRSFAPALWNNSWEDHWIYWVAPLTSSLVTSIAYKYGFRSKPENPKILGITQP
ncbi:aquaporin-like isoform X2 [Drosophila hydei]|uniref:Aquaporin-like isoform X2 n=1 Tax=Drosophila hydei TaxID=7224 RepID=A0A6J1M813_DROHY|nr:aquaporin-like isoform X2 [Drosophila hydei]